MRPKDDEKNMALVQAVNDGNVSQVSELLDQGADPNFKPFRKKNSLTYKAMLMNNIEIVKLLVQHGAKNWNHYTFIQRIFKPPCDERAQELVAHIVNYNKDVKSMQDVFIYLTLSRYREPLAVDILKFLLDQGMPVDDYCSFGFLNPLHHSIHQKRFEFVSSLVQRGANIHKKIKPTGESPFNLAVGRNMISTAELLIEKGAKINEKSHDGFAPIHRIQTPKMLCLLLKHGADVNSVTKAGYSALGCCSEPKTRIIFVKLLARMRFEDQFICNENLEDLRESRDSQQLFENCLVELKKLNDYEIENGLSLYQILRMQTQKKKLMLLTKNKSFIKKFKSCWNRTDFEYYSQDLDNIFQEAVKSRNFLLSEEKKMYSIFKDNLPDLVTRKIAFFANEDLFLNSLW